MQLHFVRTAVEDGNSMNLRAPALSAWNPENIGFDPSRAQRGARRLTRDQKLAAAGGRVAVRRAKVR